MRRVFVFAVIICFAVGAHAYAAIEGNRIGITDHGVNILGEFNGTRCDATGTNDSSACIQAAIDYCISEGAACRNTFCPDGSYKITRPVFIDPPGNLRGADGTHGSIYDSKVAYARGFTVNYNGAPYISLVGNNKGNAPASSPTDWQPFLYSPTATYPQDAVVSYNGIPWVSTQDGNTGNVPSTSSPFWRLTFIPQTHSAFSLSFVGNPGLGNAETGGGCEIRPTFANGCAIVLGTGQGMTLAHLSIRQVGNSGYRGQLPSNGAGVCSTGGPGGSSRNLVENVGVYNEYVCFKTGANNDGLDDSNTWLKTDCQNAYYCIWISQTQNDINHAIDTQCQATVAYFAGVGPGIIVDGGNPSAASSRSNSFGISSTGRLIAAGCTYDSNVSCYRFQTTLTAPDQYVCTPVYNSYEIVTAHFGVVPLVPIDSCNAPAGVVTFQISPSWGGMGFQFTNALSSTALQADIQAAKTIYAVERTTVYWGQGIRATGQHIENSNCMTLVEMGQGFSGDKGIEIDKIRFNVDPGLTMWQPSVSPTSAELAQYYCQQAFGLIIADPSAQGNLNIHDSFFDQGQRSEPILIDWQASAGPRLVMTNNYGGPFAPNVRTTGGYQNEEIGGALNPLYTARYCAACGAGDWDQSPFLPHGEDTNSEDYLYRSAGPLASPFVGFYPAPWSHPRLTPSDISKLNGITPSTALGTYPIITGSTIYDVLAYNGAPSTGCPGGTGKSMSCLAVQANQIGFSYGQNLTSSNISGLSWSAEGGSFVVYLDKTTIGYMQAGLEIGLTTSATEPYIVTGVYPGLGYITVQQAGANNFYNGITGMETTVYTGTMIAQQPYLITQYP